MASIARLGMQSWTPMERIRAIRRQRRVDITRAFFSRYVFVGLNPDHDDWRLLEDADGVEFVLTNDGSPMCVPGAVITRIRHAEAVGEFDRTKIEPDGFKLGDTVRVGEGPYSGYYGIIEEFLAKMRSTTARKRAKVLIAFLGRMVKVELPVEHLEKQG